MVPQRLVELFENNLVTHTIRLLDDTRAPASASAAAEEDMLLHLNALLPQNGIGGVDIFLGDDFRLAHLELRNHQGGSLRAFSRQVANRKAQFDAAPIRNGRQIRWLGRFA